MITFPNELLDRRLIDMKIKAEGVYPSHHDSIVLQEKGRQHACRSEKYSCWRRRRWSRHQKVNLRIVSDRITQKGVSAGGDVAGGDIDKSVHHHYPGGKSIASMLKLSESYKNERKNDAVFNKILDDLEHYQTQIPGETLVGLEGKLEAAQLNWLVTDATRLKQMFAKKLSQNLFSESAQKIFCVLLAEVLTRFTYKIKPVLDTISQRDLCDKVLGEVIEPVNEMLGENVLELHSEHISGMIYYLTGNCHIKWTK
jgi:hypothetical protein